MKLCEGTIFASKIWKYSKYKYFKMKPNYSACVTVPFHRCTRPLLKWIMTPPSKKNQNTSAFLERLFLLSKLSCHCVLLQFGHKSRHHERQEPARRPQVLLHEPVWEVPGQAAHPLETRGAGSEDCHDHYTSMNFYVQGRRGKTWEGHTHTGGDICAAWPSSKITIISYFPLLLWNYFYYCC